MRRLLKRWWFWAALTPVMAILIVLRCRTTIGSTVGTVGESTRRDGKSLCGSASLSLGVWSIKSPAHEYKQ
jgi:hypothetical protein